jgi:hypothetical protein
MMPHWKSTLAKKGAKDVSGAIKKCLAQITKVTAVSAVGRLLPYQLIFTGKSDKVIPTHTEGEPTGILYTYTATHFATVRTTLLFMEEILVPAINSQRKHRIACGASTEEQEKSRWAILIWDNFSAHLDDSVTQFLKDNRIISLPLPPQCTSKYQPLDVLVNGAEKRALTDHFSEWYFQALIRATKENPPRYDVLPVSASAKRNFIATLVAAVHSRLSGRTVFLKTAWLKATLLYAIQEPMDVDNDPNPDDDDAISVDKALINSLLKLTLKEDRDSPIDDSAEISETTVEDDPSDLAEHQNLISFTLDREESDGEMDEDEDTATRSSFFESDEDFEAFHQPSKSDDASCMSGATTSSTATSGVVNIWRPSSGRCLLVSFAAHSPALSPEEVCTLLSSRFKELKNLRLHSAQYPMGNNEGYAFQITITGVPHGTVPHYASSVTFLPHEFPNAFNRMTVHNL